MSGPHGQPWPQIALEDLDWTKEPIILVAASLCVLAAMVVIDSVARVRARRLLAPTSAAGGLADLNAVATSTVDELTGALNRRGLKAGAQRVIRAADRRGHLTGVLMVDLDGFKSVNDSLGHAAGDHILKTVADRLRDVIGSTGLVGRLGGDEFVAVFHSSDTAHAEAVATTVLDALLEPVLMDEVTLPLSASLGLHLATGRDLDVDDLIKVADESMYQAKQAGAGRWRRHGDGLVLSDEHSSEALSERLPDALRRGELVVHYQPQVAAASGSVCGFEALLRWHHPHAGLLGPVEFLPVAEARGMAGELASFVIATIAEDLPRLETVAPGCTVSFNISARTLLGSGLVRHLRRSLGAAHICPGRVVVEIVEAASNLGPDAVGVFDELRALGCLVSVQEFGVGRSSMAALWGNDAIGEVKVHPHVVRNAQSPAEDRMLRALIGAAHGVGVRVVGEGVENRDMASKLRELGCDVVQGFWIGDPMALDQAPRWARNWALVRYERLGMVPVSADLAPRGMNRAARRATADMGANPAARDNADLDSSVSLSADSTKTPLQQQVAKAES